MTQQLRVWWIPQVPMKCFYVPVVNLVEAKLLLNTLADYDQFQYDNRIKPDYCNAGGLQMLDEGEGEWIDWYDEETGKEIDDYSLDELRQEARLKFVNVLESFAKGQSDAEFLPNFRKQLQQESQ